MAEFDLFVIGAGSGGVACARRAASHGAKVGLCEEGRIGGTCVIRGCVPKKLMHYGAHFSEHLELAGHYGWRVGRPELDFAELCARRNREILRLNGVYVSMLQKAGVEIFVGRGQLAPGRGEGGLAVEVAGERHLAERVVIATGAAAQRPRIEGVELSVTSDDVLERELPLPKRVTVVGAGYIGVEMASILNGLGSETTIMLRGEEILRGFDDDLRRALSEQLRAKGVFIRPLTEISKLESKGDGAIGLETNVGAFETDMALYATGRKPNTRALGLEKLGVAVADDGAIRVDGAYRTNVEGIYAVGDCSDHMGEGMNAGQFDLTPVAIAEGRAIAETLFGDRPLEVRYDSLPTAIFSTPQAAACGLAEWRARMLGYDVEIYKTAFRPMLYAFGGEGRTMMKLVVDKASDKVLGCAMVGDDAAEMMQGFAVAITAGATKADFDATIGIHPSSAEEFVTLYAPTRS